MSALMNRADLPAVSTSAEGQADRGARIEERFEKLAISDREWHERTGIDRKTLRRAMRNEPGTRPSTFDAIEANLDKFEAKAAGRPVALPSAPDAGMVEIRIEGNFGMTAVFKGPATDIDALEQAAQRFAERMQRGNESA